MKRGISDLAWASAAWMLQCDEPMIRAVAEVEAPLGGFLADGQVRILFERHIFHRLTEGRYFRVRPDLSNPRRGGYQGGAAEHGRLQAAVELLKGDGMRRDVALRSASWGAFQIMGDNWKLCGVGSLQEFLNAMHESEESQMRLFVGFNRSDSRLLKALREHDFETYAKIYNGPGYKRNRYDTKMRAAFLRYLPADSVGEVRA